MATALQNQLQNYRTRLRTSQAGQFFRWWVGELRELLPAGMRSRMQHARRKLVIEISETDLAIGVQQATDRQQLDVFTLDQDVRVQQQQISDLLIDRDLTEVARDLLLPEARVLRKQVMLPLAAEANLRQALAYEMDRQTPFGAGDVLFDYRVIQRDKDSGQLKTDLVVSLRAPVQQDIELLAHRGLAPTGVDVEIGGRPAGLNLLPLDLRHRVVNRRARANWLLAGTAAVLLILVMVQSLWLQQHQIEETQAAIDEVRAEAMEVQRIRDQIMDTSEAASFMQVQRSAALPSVNVLAEVTRVLPDDTFLDRLLVGQGTVQMQGKSDNAQRLIELINQSEYFSDASFRGPTRMDTRTQKEIFDLTASTARKGAG